MADITARLMSEHRCFEYLLEVLELQILGCGRGESPDYFLMRDIVHYMTRYPDTRHHAWENLLFRALVRRDSRLRIVGQILEGDHLRIAGLGGALLELLENVLAGVVVSRDRLSGTGRRYVSCYRAHLRREEQDLLPAAARLSDAEIRRLVATFVASPPPWGLGGGEYSALRDHIETESAGALSGVRSEAASCPVCAAA